MSAFEALIYPPLAPGVDLQVLVEISLSAHESILADYSAHFEEPEVGTFENRVLRPVGLKFGLRLLAARLLSARSPLKLRFDLYF